MFGDIGIIVFALIGIFAKKRWAAIVATIWLITSFIIGFTVRNSNVYDFVEETFEETFTGSLWLLVIIEIALVSIAWISVAWEKSKIRKQEAAKKIADENGL